jgi:replicative DNA helicase
VLAAVETPHIENVEAECALLGAMMQSAGRSLIDPIADLVRAEDFAEPLHGRIFETILHVHGQGKTASPVTLKPLFADDPAMKELGGPSYLVKIMSASGVEIIGARDFANQIRELAEKRRLIEGLTKAIIDGRAADATPAQLVSAVEQAIAGVTERNDAATQLSAAECVKRVLEGFDKRESGVASGISPIDEGIGALLPKQLVIVAGRPSMGKSAIASSYALGAASAGHGVLFVSLEMSAEELGERIASDMSFDSPCQVPYSAITDKRVTTEQGRQIARAYDRLQSMPLSIVDLASCTVSKLNSLVRRHARRLAANGKKLELVIVDYLQLIRPDRNTENRTQEITQVSMGLKAIAKEHGVAVMALAQLSRSVEARADKRPIMADLRESGQIEQDADAIMFLYRPEYYLQQSEPRAPAERPKWEASMDDARGKIEFIVAKRRRGRTGTSHGRFYGAFQAVRG